MAKIFISYRRSDSEFVADAIYNEMQKHFGQRNVFLDVGDIPYGIDFRYYLDAQLQKHDVILVLIGPDWADSMKARRDSENDFVRMEIETALKLNKIVVPVLVKKLERLPDFDDLPSSIRELQWRNAISVRREPDFKEDCNRLAQSIFSLLTNNKEVSPSQPVLYELSTQIEKAYRFDGTKNTDWRPFVTSITTFGIDDIPFCLVPKGEFYMGSNDGKENEIPPHKQQIINPYWISQYPVTNSQWKQGVIDGIVDRPKDDIALNWYEDSSMANAPVVGIDWFMAYKFAEWLGCRLPTEMEWEYAARGIESYKYPWGNEWKPEYVIWQHNRGEHPSDILVKPEGKSWIAAWHMIGNVWEWTGSRYEPYPYSPHDGRERNSKSSVDILRVMRGGSWNDMDRKNLRSSYRSLVTPSYYDHCRGFRLARSIDQANVL